MKSLRLFLATMLLGTWLSAESVELGIDNSHSHVIFKIKHLMISNVTGEFKTFDGEIEADLKEKKITKFTGVVDATSVDTGIEKRDNHLRSPDFFNVSEYPEIKFEMTSYSKSFFGDAGTMKGNFTLHGITKEIELEVEMTEPIKFMDSEKVGMTLKGEIRRSDFGLKWNKALEAGGLAVGDEVKITIELETTVF
ncbi:MAG: YceI family protein [Campylobacterales bacterium]|nr:YceI family protein [Campylobacterales bacterium]